MYSILSKLDNIENMLSNKYRGEESLAVSIDPTREYQDEIMAVKKAIVNLAKKYVYDKYKEDFNTNDRDPRFYFMDFQYFDGAFQDSSSVLELPVNTLVGLIVENMKDKDYLVTEPTTAFEPTTAPEPTTASEPAMTASEPIQDLSEKMIEFFASKRRPAPCTFLKTGHIWTRNREDREHLQMLGFHCTESGRAESNFGGNNKSLYKYYIDNGFADAPKRRAYLQKVKQEIVSQLDRQPELSQHRWVYTNLPMEQYIGIKNNRQPGKDIVYHIDPNGVLLYFPDGTNRMHVNYHSHA